MPRARRARGQGRIPLLLMLAMLGAGLVALAALGGGAWKLARAGERRTTISQELVVEKVREVAQVISSEMTVRDVVTFEDTYYGSTKRALLVVTGRILAGIDLDRGTDVRIDPDRRHITITIPEATVLAVDIVQLRTYDEQRGLWNTFQPADRDAIYQRVRRQLFRSAEEMGIVQRANRSAARLLETMFTVDGYTAEVRLAAPPEEARRDTGALRGD